MKVFLPLVILFFCCITGYTQTWTGAVSSDWNTAGNWTSPSSVPTAASNVTLPGSVPSNRWPVLATDITVNNLNTNPGCQLNVNGHVINIFSTNVYNNLYGGNITNSNGATDIVININTGTNGYTTQLRSTTFSDHVIFNLTGVNQFIESDNGTGNIFNGNTTVNCNSGLTVLLSHAIASTYNGNLIVTRTVAGPTQLFNAGAMISGNFSYTNNTAGDTRFGNNAYKTAIAGTITIAAHYTTPDNFQMYRLVNQTAGGVINVFDSRAIDVQQDTLKVTAMSLVGYMGNAYAYFFSNHITGNVTMADDFSYTNGYTTSIRNNTFNGNFTISVNGTNQLNEADQANSANTYNGNAFFTAQGSGSLYLSHASVSVFNGNLSINRTAAGHTQAFNAGGNIKGSFTFNTNADGNSYFGNLSYRTLILGTVNVFVKNTVPGEFVMHRVINQTNGGSFLIDSTRGFNIQNDTLLLSSFRCLKYFGNQYAYLYNNQITAAITVADDVSYAGGYSLQVRNNLFTGNSSFTHRGTNTILEADAGNSSNTFNGNSSFFAQGNNSIYLSHGAPSVFNGNLSITRTANGHTQVFNAGGTVTGNFSYINLADGNSYLGNLAMSSIINGTLNVSVKNASPAEFRLHRVTNLTNGGTLSIDSTRGFDIQSDTLKLTSFNCLRYYGNGYAFLFNNHITANTTIMDDVAYAGGYSLQVRSNVFTGNTSMTHKGSNALLEADAGASANIYNGNTSFSFQGNNQMLISQAAASQFNGNLTVSRTTNANTTRVFNAGGKVTGNFVFSNNIGGGTYLGNSGNTVVITGQVNITVDHAGNPSDMVLYRLKNQSAGGSVSLLNTRGVDMRSDTLIVNTVAIGGYKTGNYAYFFNNHITGNVSFADDISYSGGYATYIRENTIVGNSNITNNGSNSLWESDAGSIGNKYMGNASFSRLGTGSINIGQSLITEVAQAFTVTAAGGVGINNLRLNGNTNGSITQGGTLPITINRLYIDKASSAQTILLNDSVTIVNNAELNTGIILAAANKNLVFLNNATCTNAGNNSHVKGPVSKVGSQAFVFPVGNGFAIQTAAISAPSNATDRIRAEYFDSSPHPAYDTSNRAVALKVVSGAQYWLIDRLAGNNNIIVTLEYGPPRGVAITANQADYRVARWTGSTWSDLGNAATTGTALDGTVQAASGVTSFSPFTIAATSVIQPLVNTPGALSPACANSPMTINFQSSGVFNAGNVFTAQLSNASGSFANPLNIGSVAAVPNGFNVANVINAYLPSSEIATGTGYRVRIVSSNPVQPGSSNSSNITINSLYLGPDTTVALSCAGGTINLLPLYNTTGLTVNWNTGNPSAAVPGSYRLAVANGLGCKDTAFATVVLKVATWTGTTSNNWHTASNWSTNKVPDATTHVIVNLVAANPCVVSAANAQAASVQVLNGATVNTTNGKLLTVSGTCSTFPPH